MMREAIEYLAEAHRVALVFWLALSMSIFASAQSRNSAVPAAPEAEAQVMAAIRGRLAAAAANDIEAWAQFVADDMLAPLEGMIASRQA